MKIEIYFNFGKEDKKETFVNVDDFHYYQEVLGKDKIAIECQNTGYNYMMSNIKKINIFKEEK